MADELAGLIAHLARRNVHLTRRQLLRALAATGLGVAGLGQFLGAPDTAAAYPTLRALLASASPAAAAGVEGGPAEHGASLRGDTLPAKERLREGRFGLLFKDAPPYAPPDHLLSTLAREMAEASAPMAADDALHDNGGVPAGYTFFGQFVDHDLTLDRTPLGEAQADVDAVQNFRSARYDLDSVYGGGPVADPQLYDPADPVKLRVGAPGDLPRQPDGRAILVEGRNDENAILGQLHVAFLRFHNALVDQLRAGGMAADRVFAKARQLARWYNQWAVLRDFLPRLVGPALMGDLVRERPDGRVTTHVRFFHPANPARPMLPVKFAAAAYRFGHSTIRPSYTINDTDPKAIFGATAADGNLNGGRPLTPARLVDWATAFPTEPARPPQSSRRVDTRLALPLHQLPAPSATRCGASGSACRRGRRWPAGWGWPRSPTSSSGCRTIRAGAARPPSGTTSLRRPSCSTTARGSARSGGGSSGRCWSGCARGTATATWRGGPTSARCRPAHLDVGPRGRPRRERVGDRDARSL